MIQNAIYNLHDGKWYISIKSWDLIPFEVSDGTSLFIDGGNEYQRKNFEFHPDVVDWCLYEDSDHEMIKDRLLWGTYGKDGKSQLTWIPLSKCEDDHLIAILTTQKHLNKKTKLLIEEILQDRGVKI